MSTELIKSVKIDRVNKEVIIRGCSTNSEPRDYSPRVSTGLSEMLANEGEEALFKEMLYCYWQKVWKASPDNAVSSAVKVYNVKNPTIGWRSIGRIKDEDVVFCPMEELPKYINLSDSRVADFARRRLKGEEFDRATFIPAVIMNHDELKEALYQEYLSYKKRKKEKHYICVRDRDSFGNGEQFFCQPRGKYYTHCYTIKEAMIFDSLETAALMFHKYCNGSEIRSKLTTHAVRKVSDYDE